MTDTHFASSHFLPADLRQLDVNDLPQVASELRTAMIDSVSKTGGLQAYPHKLLMAFEALNNAGALDARLIVILNDNDMSIAPPSGAMSAYLAKLATGGFGAQVLQFMAGRGLLDHGLKVRSLTLPDEFTEQAKPEVMYSRAGLDHKGIVATALATLDAETTVLKTRA